MSLGAVAARLYTIQSKKNLPLSAAFSQIVRENLAVRFSVYSLVRSITKSETLATIAQAKYGKKTPEERAADKEKQTARQSEVKFRRYVAGSIVSLNKKIDAVSAVVQKNTQLIEALYNDVGSYKRQRRMNVRGAAQVSSRVPLQNRTVKGKIDQINADLEKIKKMDIAAKKKKAVVPEKTKKQQQEETGGLISMILGGLIKNPTLMLGLATGRLAIPLARYGIPALAAANLPTNLGIVAGRLQGKQGYQNLQSEQMSQAITPALAGLGTYAAGMYLTKAYQAFKKPGMSKADRVYGGRIEELERQKQAKKLSLQDKYYNKMYGRTGLTAAPSAPAGGYGTIAREQRLRKYYDAKLKRTKTFEGFERVKKEYVAAMEKSKQRDAARLKNIATDPLTAKRVQGKNMMARISSTVDKQYEIPVGRSFNQMKKWNKISSALSGLTKRIPSLTAAYIVYKVAEMSNYVVEKDMRRMSPDEYKRNMVNSYADMIGAVGPGGLGAIVGGLAGTALFPGVGTATLAMVGGALGAAYGLFSDSFDEGSMWLAGKVFEIFHEDKPVKLKKKEEVKLPSEEQLAPTTSRPPSVYAGPAVNQPVNMQALQDATTDKDFMSEVMRVSNKFAINPEDLLSVMAIETAGTFRPDIKNPNSTAVGLLQFTEDTAKRMGTTTSALAMMSRAGQMKYVEKYFEMWNLPKGASAAEIYSKVFLPGRSDQYVLTKKGENFYELNRGLDINNDGQIDKFDLNEWTGRKKAELPRMLGRAGLLEEGADTKIVATPPEKPQETPVAQTDAVVQAQVNSTAAVAAIGAVQQQLNVVSSEMIKDRRYNRPEDPTVVNLDMEQYNRNSIFGRA